MLFVVCDDPPLMNRRGRKPVILYPVVVGDHESPVLCTSMSLPESVASCVNRQLVLTIFTIRTARISASTAQPIKLICW